MKSGLYWTAVALLIAAVSHLSYVLIAPSLAMQRLIGDPGEAAEVNRFVLLEPAEQVRLLGETASEAVSGKCVFDIRKGELSVAAELPDTFWTLTLYSDRGNDLYTINDRQAGINSFKLTVKRAPGMLDLLRRDPTETHAMADGWTAEIPEPSGIAVFWVALDYPEQRQLFTEILSRST